MTEEVAIAHEAPVLEANAKAQDPPPTPTLNPKVETNNDDVKKEITTTGTDSATSTNSQTEPLHKHEDDNPLLLKSMYVLKTYHPIMTPLASDPRSISSSSSSNKSKSNNNKQKENRHKKNKRELKKRSRENDGAMNKVCKPFLVGKCPYGDQCKYSHDLKEMLATREDDIKEIGSCPHFDLKGKCPYGIACRIGAKHLNLATGQNICKSDEEIEALRKKYNTKVMNVLDRSVSIQLSRKRYKFVCKRFNDRSGKKNRINDKSTKVEDFTKKIQVKKEEDVKLEDAVNRQDYSDPPSADDLKKEPDVKMEEQNNDDTAKPSDDSKKVKKEEEESQSPSILENTAIKKEDDNVEVILEDPKTDCIESKEIKLEPVSGDNTVPVSPRVKPPIDLSPLPKTRKIIDFSNKVYIAPLTTVGNLPFRRVMKKFGADITCGEMAVATNLLQGKNSEWALLKRHPDEDIFGVQIAAAHADVYTRLGEVIENEHLDVDFLDMNLGCPIDVLCNQGCGAKLMLNQNKLRDSLKGMLNVLNIPVTIKIRTGWEEKKPIAHKLVPKIQEWSNGGVAAVMVHGRSRLQRYSRLANWDYIQEVQLSQRDSIPKIPIIGNGDIFSYNDYEEKVLKREGLSPTAMLGRGALIKPWLPTEIKEKRHWDISATERLEFLKDFVRFGLEHWGSDQQGVNTTRRFLLEWLSFLYRYVPVGLLEVLPQSMNQRPPAFMCGRNDLETLMLSKNSKDWVKISEMLLGPVPEGFEFEPKHKANSYK